MKTLGRPPVSGKEVCKILEQHGFQFIRQRGSHMVMQKKIESATIIGRASRLSGWGNRGASVATITMIEPVSWSGTPKVTLGIRSVSSWPTFSMESSQNNFGRPGFHYFSATLTRWLYVFYRNVDLLPNSRLCPFLSLNETQLFRC